MDRDCGQTQAFFIIISLFFPTAEQSLFMYILMMMQVTW